MGFSFIMIITFWISCVEIRQSTICFALDYLAGAAESPIDLDICRLPPIHPIIATLIFHGQNTHSSSSSRRLYKYNQKKDTASSCDVSARRYKVLLPPGYIMLGINC